MGGVPVCVRSREADVCDRSLGIPPAAPEHLRSGRSEAAAPANKAGGRSKVWSSMDVAAPRSCPSSADCACFGRTCELCDRCTDDRPDEQHQADSPCMAEERNAEEVVCTNDDIEIDGGS